MTIDLRVVSAPDGGWMVALDEQSLAGFYGPDARRLAESHRDVLVELLAEAPQEIARYVSSDSNGEARIH
jgi:hypothetical protein